MLQNTHQKYKFSKKKNHLSDSSQLSLLNAALCNLTLIMLIKYDG